MCSGLGVTDSVSDGDADSDADSVAVSEMELENDTDDVRLGARDRVLVRDPDCVSEGVMDDVGVRLQG